MKIALVNPPLQRGGAITPHLGLAVLANALLGQNHEIEWLDLDLEKECREHFDWHSSLAYFAKRLRLAQPDVVACTAMFNNSVLAEDIFVTARKTLPDVTTVAGGSHFGVLAERALQRNPHLDFVIVREGEEAICDLVHALQHKLPTSGIANLAYQVTDHHQVALSQQSVVTNADRPLVDLHTESQICMWERIRNVVPMERYLNTFAQTGHDRSIYIEAGRGCPFRCNFCATAPFWQHKYRVKNPQMIATEMAWLHNTYGFTHFMLVHDLLTVRRDFMEELCDRIFDLRLPITWMANSRIDLHQPTLTPKLRSSGCSKLFFGIESGDDEVQAFTKKKLKTDKVGEVVNQLAEQGVTSTCSFVVGFPTETSAHLLKSLKLALQVKLLGAETVQVHRLRLWPPAPLVEQVQVSEFDASSLRLEWPFATVDEHYVEQIVEDKAFFSGYHYVQPEFGSNDLTAKIETFFTAAIATVPLATAALIQIAEARFLNTFMQLAERPDFQISNQHEEHCHSVLYAHWLSIEIEYRRLCDCVCEGFAEEKSMVLEILQYEVTRLSVCEAAAKLTNQDDVSEYQQRISLRLDIRSVLALLQQGDKLEQHDASLFAGSDIVLKRAQGYQVEAYLM